MTNAKPTQEIITLVAKIVKQPVDKVTLEANLFTDLRVDSLLGVEIFAALDKKYGLNVPEDKLREVTTVKDLVDLVESLKK